MVNYFPLKIYYLKISIHKKQHYSKAIKCGRINTFTVYADKRSFITVYIKMTENNTILLIFMQQTFGTDIK